MRRALLERVSGGVLAGGDSFEQTSTSSVEDLLLSGSLQGNHQAALYCQSTRRAKLSSWANLSLLNIVQH